jgi:hypothetical protein
VLPASGDLAAYWRHHEQRELERNHAARNVNGKIPALTRPGPASRRKTALLDGSWTCNLESTRGPHLPQLKLLDAIAPNSI